MALTTFYYDQQFKKYIHQFCAIFAGIQVEGDLLPDGSHAMIAVPVSYGSKDRVVAAIRGSNTQNALLKVPAIAAYMSALSYNADKKKGGTTTRSTAHLPIGGVYPDDIQVIQQMVPLPYVVTMDVMLIASNQEQHLQMLEQILILFDPVVQIQKSDSQFDWGRITTAELVGIALNENYPAGTERRIIQTQLTFEFVAYLSAPANVRNDYIRRVLLRIGASQGTTPEEIITDLDLQGAVYEVVEEA